MTCVATAPIKRVWVAGTDAALRMVEEAIAVADPRPTRSSALRNAFLASTMLSQAWTGGFRSQRREVRHGEMPACPRSAEYTRPFFSRASRAGDARTACGPGHPQHRWWRPPRRSRSRWSGRPWRADSPARPASLARTGSRRIHRRAQPPPPVRRLQRRRAVMGEPGA